MTFEHYTGNEYTFTVPSTIDGTALSTIGAKAFLSNKTLHELILPDTITALDNWAFAHMHNLERLHVPCTNLQLGRQVFLDCPKLRCISVSNDTSENPGLPYFLASVLILLQKEFLFTPQSAADKLTHADWMKEYDSALFTYLNTPDDAGFEPVFYGWFNVQDVDDQIPAYLQEVRRKKTYLVFLRLLYPLYLHPDHKAQLQSYLADHVPGGAREKEHIAVWDSLKEDGYGEDIRYILVLEDAGILTETQIARLLTYLQPGNPEVIAYLLKLHDSCRNRDNSFDQFIL